MIADSKFEASFGIECEGNVLDIGGNFYKEFGLNGGDTTKKIILSLAGKRIVVKDKNWSDCIEGRVSRREVNKGYVLEGNDGIEYELLYIDLSRLWSKIENGRKN